MRAIAVKEFRELRRDRRTLAMLFLLPFLFLVVFGYAASFDVKDVPTVVVGPRPPRRDRRCPPRSTSSPPTPDGDRAARRGAAAPRRSGRRGRHAGRRRRRGGVLIDGTELFAAQAALRSLAELGGRRTRGGGVRRAGPARRRRDTASQVDVLYNPDLRTAVIMIPGLCGIILVFVGTIATALGVVRERQSGTMEQLAVMPFRPRDVFLGKIAPYLLIAAADMVDRRGGRHAAVRRALPRVRRDVRARRAAVPLRHPRDRRAHLERLADPGAGDPAGRVDHGAAVPAERPLLPAVLDAVGRALDRLPAAADLVHQGRARRDGARRAHRRAVAAAADPGGDGRRRVHRLHAAVPPRPGPGRTPEGAGDGRASRRRRCRRTAGDAG